MTKGSDSHSYAPKKALKYKTYKLYLKYKIYTNLEEQKFWENSVY